MSLRVAGATFSVLHAFTTVDSTFANNDGAFPNAPMLLVGSTLYGTTSQGGQGAGGSIFKIGTDGTSFITLYSFTPPNPGTGVIGDGAYPLGGLTLVGTSLFGTTSAGGAFDDGIIFKLNTDGTGFKTVYTFSAADPTTSANADGASPWAALAVSGTTLFGATTRGGDAGLGTVFKLNSDGTAFTRLHSFTALDATSGTNSDGAYPLGGVIIWSNAVYGTTYRGGVLGTGTVFKVNLDGSGFKTLQSLNGGPRAALTALNGVLYGTTEAGGTFGGGTVFRINTDGTGFTNLQSFANDAGNGPWAGLISSSNVLYGTTYGGGDSGQGSVFELNPDGTGFQNLYSFSGADDGSHPQASVTAATDALYGTASDGGLPGDGTVFKLSLSQSATQQLTIDVSGPNVVLRWPSGVAGQTLQSTTNLASPIVWSGVTPGPSVVNGFNTVTNPISSGARFYRLGP